MFDGRERERERERGREGETVLQPGKIRDEGLRRVNASAGKYLPGKSPACPRVDAHNAQTADGFRQLRYLSRLSGIQFPLEAAVALIIAIG